MKHDLTTGTRQDDNGCPISIILAATSDEGENLDLSLSRRDKSRDQLDLSQKRSEVIVLETVIRLG